MPELIDRYATIDAIPAPTDADEAEYYGKICNAIEAMPTIEPEVRNGQLDEDKPLTNGDRIRAMTDEELSVFLGGIADNCTYNTCDNCPMYGACVDVPLSRDKWLSQEVEKR